MTNEEERLKHSKRIKRNFYAKKLRESDEFRPRIVDEKKKRVRRERKISVRNVVDIIEDTENG